MTKLHHLFCIAFFSWLTQTSGLALRKDGRTFSKRNSEFYKRRNEGLKIKRGKKPPKWEKEGDLLYREISGNNEFREKYQNQKITYSIAQELLLNLENIGIKHQFEKAVPVLQKENVNKESDISPFSWGGLSVGPVWKERLLKAGFSAPLPIQSESFVPIAKKKNNVIIASTTGSGKSLAYLLPLLAAGGKKATGTVWIVTPTLELAVQLFRVVENLQSDRKNPLLHVVGYEDDYFNKLANKERSTEPFAFLEKVIEAQSHMLAGTPKMMQKLVEELDLASSLCSTASTKSVTIAEETLSKKASEISKNLQTIVLDETDKLLKTETIARNLQQQLSGKNSSKKKLRRKNTITSTEKLLNILISRHPDQKLQFICASATVGRILRKQLMKITQSPSTEKTAILVTADVRTKKDAIARKISLLPSTLQHAYILLKDVKQEDNSKEEAEENNILRNLLETLPKLKPAPTLIFPGRINVLVVQEELRNNGFKDIRGIDTLNLSEEIKPILEEKKDWRSTPIYVIGEKLGRGLDLQGIGYVMLLKVPSSAAGYTHLAGRTGRNGAMGTAITFCQPREAPKLLAIADTLGLSFSNILPDKEDDQAIKLDAFTGDAVNNIIS
mmetsp:Transcript_37320/g.42646  ORF Transcript_37320/g.42646 Transcript_37320/m.42646 type:complete len:615 (+) Transcript_37320:110-1954(+)|eukprot:CAMPEP_0194155470 /NCGR_PEP_ID=MMETSP0152-20130528/64690_1 /TAXON_ID=1049557 /ORGANISM="Thalassiothrix antarctica, Strain L6-D1" /LENGTH=614 /DNA_ID=CAMNT_0038862359 /DNA_START=103 /DNA_END=1947 /DNA_ORIENTATION=+